MVFGKPGGLSGENGEPEKTVYTVDDIPRFDVTELSHNIRDRNRFLKNIIELFNSNQPLLNIVVMNGSLGTNDYRPGWSDVDIFCNLSREAVSSEENLKKTRELVRHVNREIFAYNVLQLHGVFLSTEIDLLFHTDTLFPRVPCFERGRIIYSKRDEYTLHTAAASTLAQAAARSFNDIYSSSTGLLCGGEGRELSLGEKVLLLHRIYAFPFTFLQCLGVRRYKKDSFRYLVDNYSDLFPEVERFYREMNDCYINWNVSRLRTLGVRSRLLRHFHPYLVNGLMAGFEREIRRGVDGMYARFDEWHRERFLEYLETAKDRLAKVNS
jgi:hypothetical protein